eukprot:GHVR01185239.1.p1 GENE.GHVR01185239.1~~GHVR01185239.1.p1  ORF type:complete len:181 (-),score=31.52 GHVR01185239.1:97-639(-)
MDVEQEAGAAQGRHRTVRSIAKIVEEDAACFGRVLASNTASAEPLQRRGMRKDKKEAHEEMSRRTLDEDQLVALCRRRLCELEDNKDVDDPAAEAACLMDMQEQLEFCLSQSLFRLKARKSSLEEIEELRQQISLQYLESLHPDEVMFWDIFISRLGSTFLQTDVSAQHKDMLKICLPRY